MGWLETRAYFRRAITCSASQVVSSNADSTLLAIFPKGIWMFFDLRASRSSLAAIALQYNANMYGRSSVSVRKKKNRVQGCLFLFSCISLVPATLDHISSCSSLEKQKYLVRCGERTSYSSPGDLKYEMTIRMRLLPHPALEILRQYAVARLARDPSTA